MENKLISMVDFVKYEHQIWDESSVAIVDDIDYINCTSKYAKLLSQPLQKSMFVPCGEDGEVLDAFVHHVDVGFSREYQQAKERCLFEGFEVIHKDKVRTTIQCDFLQLDYNNINNLFENYKTIEDLVKYNLTLTATALKQIER